MTEKLHKVLADLGLGSRREMERWISANRVKVNGKVAKLGDRVERDEPITVDGHSVRTEQSAPKRVRVIVYNKQEGEITSRKDPEGRPSVFDKLPRLHNERWISVGRLDINTSGLLLFTTDGELANSLMHPRNEIEREYVCRIMATDVDEAMLQRLRNGVDLEDGPAKFTRLEAMRGEGINRWFSVSLNEGKNREIRRLWESQGVMVNRLKRVSYGCISLPSFVSQGDWLELNPKEMKALYKMANVKPKGSLKWLPNDISRYERQVSRLRRGGRK